MIQGATYIDLPGEPGISSEIDRDPFFEFVVCGPEGLYAIEVKGGRVACRDGVWRYRDRNGGSPCPRRVRSAGRRRRFTD